MNIEKKYNSLILSIEHFIDLHTLSEDFDIVQSVSKTVGMSTRDISTILTYIMGMSLNAYIRERKMMHAYKLLMEQGYSQAVAQQMIAISGYDGAPSFLKAFKRLFGLAPKDAAEKKDMTKLKPPLFWDRLQKTDTGESMTKTTSPKKTPTADSGMSAAVSELVVSKMSLNILALYREIEDLHAFYGGDEEITILACRLVMKKDLALKDAFKYVCDVRSAKSIPYIAPWADYGDDWETEQLMKHIDEHLHGPRHDEEDEDDDIKVLSPFELLEDRIMNPELLHFYMCGIPVSVAEYAIDKIHEWTDEDLSETDPDLVRLFLFSRSCAYVYIKDCFEYMRTIYNGNDESVFHRYAKNLDENMFKEYALDDALRYEGVKLDEDGEFDDWDDIDLSDIPMSFEEAWEEDRRMFYQNDDLWREALEMDGFEVDDTGFPIN